VTKITSYLTSLGLQYSYQHAFFKGLTQGKRLGGAGLGFHRECLIDNLTCSRAA
jgi:hypothetical protein